jgi:hypothetical protein
VPCAGDEENGGFSGGVRHNFGRWVCRVERVRLGREMGSV